MVLGALSVFLAIGLAYGVYDYVNSLDARSERVYLEGEMILRPGSYEAAIAKFDRAISLNSRNEKAHLARGEAFGVLGRNDEALRAYSRVIELKPDWSRGYAARGKLYRSLGDNEKALADLNKSVELEANPENLLERGQAYASLGQWQKAIDDYSGYISFREGVPYPYTLRSQAKQQLGDETGAREDKIQALVIEKRIPPRFGKTEDGPGALMPRLRKK
jgi:tetratricopeptide (TPR) repeat protein